MVAIIALSDNVHEVHLHALVRLSNQKNIFFAFSRLLTAVLMDASALQGYPNNLSEKKLCGDAI